MGGGASRNSDEFESSFGAFIEAKVEYENAVRENEDISSDDLLNRVKEKFFTAKIEATNSIEKGILKRGGNELDLSMGKKLENEEIEIRVGDIVKVKDRSQNVAFYFEGVVMQIHDGNALVNFGDDVISDDPDDIEKEFPP